MTGGQRLDAVEGSVTVSFDEARRPTVTAGSIQDAAFGLGWCVSRHRAGQLDALRRRGQGRMAELAGPAAVAADLRQRTLGLPAVARRCWAVLPGPQRELLTAFAAGANEAADESWWGPLDSIAVAQVLFQQLASDGSELRMVEVMRRTLSPGVVEFLLAGRDDFETAVDGSVPDPEPPVPVPVADLRRLMAERPPAGPAPLVVSDRPPVGSNGWAVCTDGRAVLANDMHLELTSPSLWYAVRLALPDADVAGVTVPGLPLVVAGSNGSVAWGFTRVPGDTVDLLEVRPGSSPERYRVGDAEEPYTLRRERIVVRDAPAVVAVVRETRWGPVVAELAGRPVVERSTLTDPAALDFGAADLCGTADVEAAVRVVTNAGLPPVNVLLADSGGRVAWTVGGRFVRRPGGPRGIPRAEDAAAPEWMPPAELPRVIAPPSGLVVSCNQGHEAVRATGIAWNSFSGVRARRVVDVLTAGGGRDEAGGLRLQLDPDASLYSFYRDLALRQLGGRGPDGEARAEIEAWDGTSDRDARGLALLVTFRELLREELLASVTRPCRAYDPGFTYCVNAHEGTLRALIDVLEPGLVPAPWPGPAEFLRAQVLIARTLLRRRTGLDRPVHWGEINQLARVPLGTPGPVDDPPVELSGCPDSVLVAQPDFGASMRLVVDPGRPERGLLSLPGSADGRPPLEAASLLDWVAGRAAPLLPGTNRSARPAAAAG